MSAPIPVGRIVMIMPTQLAAVAACNLARVRLEAAVIIRAADHVLILLGLCGLIVLLLLGLFLCKLFGLLLIGLGLCRLIVLLLLDLCRLIVLLLLDLALCRLFVRSGLFLCMLIELLLSGLCRPFVVVLFAVFALWPLGGGSQRREPKK
jgi:hypothetical protein